MTIMKECMVVNLQVGVWLGYRLDKTTTRRVTEEADAAPDAARVNKHLVPKEALSDIVSCAGSIHRHFYDRTLPWKDNGDRLLTRRISLDFIQEHEELATKFNSAVREFITRKYLIAKEQAEFRMGDMFNINDYPTPAELRHKFYVSMDIDGVAVAKDIRLDDSTEVLQARVTKAIGGLWGKIATPLAKFAETMSDENAMFRNTTVSNLREIVDMIPALNFTDDPALEKIRQEIEKQITRYEPDDLRKDKTVRAAVAEEAKSIMDSMAGFMNAFGQGSDDDGE
jgi:hypothetical protein